MANLRKYGKAPFEVVVVHGGPGAAGEMAPVARKLVSICGVLEPLQTVASLKAQVEELKTVLEKNADFPVTLIGFSWGAWLSFIFTANYPEFVKKQKQLEHCGLCPDFPCKTFFELRDPNMSDDEFNNSLAERQKELKRRTEVGTDKWLKEKSGI